MPSTCNICGRDLDDPDDETSRDCGGDCLRCMALFAGDPDCALSLAAIEWRSMRENVIHEVYGASDLVKSLDALFTLND